MVLRNVPITYTLDQQRQEINNLAADFNSVDVGFNEKVDDRVNAFINPGTGIATVYDDVSNSLTVELDFTEFTTASIPEGAVTNYYYTEARAAASIAAVVDRAFVENLAIQSLGVLNEINLVTGVNNKTVTAVNYNNAHWDLAYGWGDHSQAGYVTAFSETDTLDTVTDRGAVTTNTINVGKLKTNHIESIDTTDTIILDGNLVDINSNLAVGNYSTGIGTDYGVLLDSTGGLVINHNGQGTALNLKTAGTSNFSVDATGKLNGLFALPASDGGVGQFLKTDGNGQLGWTTQDSASVVVGDDAPSSPEEGDLWWESDAGRLKVYYANGANPATWIDASPPLQAPRPNSALRLGVGNVTANNGAQFSDTNGTFLAQVTVSDYDAIHIGVTFGYLDGTASSSGSIILQRVVSGTATDIFTVYCPVPATTNGPLSFVFDDVHGQVTNTVIQYQLKLDLAGQGNRSTGTTYGSQINLHEI